MHMYLCDTLQFRDSLLHIKPVQHGTSLSLHEAASTLIYLSPGIARHISEPTSPLQNYPNVSLQFKKT